MKEVTYEEIRTWSEDSYVLIDVRDEGLRTYGMMPGAISVDQEKLESNAGQELKNIEKHKKLVFYCEIGRRSRELQDEISFLQEWDCYSLKDGYVGYVRLCLAEKEKELQHKAEESIRKKFHKQLFSPFAKACKTYQLIKEGDRIAVCISGGKDSMLMAKLFQEIRTHRQVSFDLIFLVMDPGYNTENRALIESNAKALGIPITIFESDIFDAVDTIEKNPCYLCARMRRGYLYSKAKELGCNKIALGHHYDDVIETILMGMLHGGQVQTMMPKLHSTNFEGIELIRPMYLIRESADGSYSRMREENNMAIRFTKENFETEVLKSEIPVFVDFYADWCGPCKMMAPAIDRLAAEFEGKVKVGKFNVDDDMDLAERFGITNIPNMKIFQGGEVAESIVGVTTEGIIRESLEKFIK